MNPHPLNHTHERLKAFYGAWSRDRGGRRGGRDEESREMSKGKRQTEIQTQG